LLFCVAIVGACSFTFTLLPSASDIECRTLYRLSSIADRRLERWLSTNDETDAITCVGLLPVVVDEPLAIRDAAMRLERLLHADRHGLARRSVRCLDRRGRELATTERSFEDTHPHRESAGAYLICILLFLHENLTTHRLHYTTGDGSTSCFNS